MCVLTLFTTFKEKNYVVFAKEKDKAGMVRHTINLILAIVMHRYAILRTSCFFHSSGTRSLMECKVNIEKI